MKPRVEVDFNAHDWRAFRCRKPDYCPKANEFLLNHARSGLLIALQSLELPQGSKVGVMAYNCHTVMNAVAQAGLKPVFIDIDEGMRLDFNDLRKKAVGMKALIVTHLFGIVNDVEAIQREFPQMIVVEDCAHAFGKEIVGDFGVFSIGQGKLPSLGDGGILTVNNSQYADAVKGLCESLPEYSRSEENKLYVKLLLTDWLHKEWLYGLFTSRWKQRKKPQSGREAIVAKKMSEGVKAMYALRKDGVPEQVKRRLANAAKEAKSLQDNELVSNVLFGSNAFMLVVHTTNLAALKAQYARRGIETATHFANSILWAREFGYQGDCPNAERLSRELLMIPVY